MKRTELIMAAVALIALVLNLMLIPGSTSVLTLTLLLFTVFYLVFGFAILNGIGLKTIFRKESYRGISGLRIVLAVLLGYGLASASAGVLFGLQNMEGAGIMLTSSLLQLIFFSLLVLIEFLISKSDFYKRTLPRIAVWGGLVLVLSILPTDAILEFKYRNYPEYLEALKNERADPGNQQLRYKTDQEWQKMERR